MTWWLLTFALELLALVVVGAVVLPDRRPKIGWLQERLTRKVIVHTRDSHSIEGLLEAERVDGLVLRGARYLDESPAVAMAGEIFIPRDQVAMVQVQSPT